ncbi:homeodomain-interacting protein kinase 3-like isoform X2 [Scophthalmus maximus]|uniref:homeodomain-interacting protein kinase 3-like isoform X2 n=1 Tax=Scophthalmus maximus TaxID=52904 RepID=UPI0015E14F2D|nr:homeodomain-interacting protein kinase 3-like isoform X2 [Scophthalmus maximus]
MKSLDQQEPTEVMLIISDNVITIQGLSSRAQKSHPMMATNTSAIVPAQHYQLVTGGCLTSESSTYKVQCVLGQGTFGTVVKCTRMVDMKTVAIKMIRNEGRYVQEAKMEVAALKKLKALDPDKCNFVQWYQVFVVRGHICLEFEHLDKSLADFMKERLFRPLLLKEIRPIVQQLATALGHLKAAGIAHADLKLENVMLVNQLQQPFRVKLIDFGQACEVSAARVGSCIQTCPYRSPEIILGLPFSEAIDMWSLGCMSATLFTGTLLYPGRNGYDTMRYIVRTQGQPPDTVLNLGRKTSQIFKRGVNTTGTQWKLKTPEQFYKPTEIPSPMWVQFTSLDDLRNIWIINPDNSADSNAKKNDVLMFVHMVKKMLQLDATKRITPHELLGHQFINMRYIAGMYPQSNYVKSSLHLMDVKRILSFDPTTAVCGSWQQPPSRRANPVQSNLPSHAKWSSVVWPQCANLHPRTNTEATGSDRSGIKIKPYEEDVVPRKRTAVPCSENNRGSCRKRSADPSTAGWISRTQTCVSSQENHVNDRCWEFGGEPLRRVYGSTPCTPASRSLDPSKPNPIPITDDHLRITKNTENIL